MLDAMIDKAKQIIGKGEDVKKEDDEESQIVNDAEAKKLVKAEADCEDEFQIQFSEDGDE